MSKGKDFEYVTVYEAWNFAGVTGTEMVDITRKYNSAAVDVRNTNPLNYLFNQVGLTRSDPATYAAKQSMAASFRLLGGSNPEPKTDVLFTHAGTTYKLSLKWGDSFQASSAGVEGSAAFIDRVSAASINLQNYESIAKFLLLMNDVDDVIGESAKGSATEIDAKLSRMEDQGLQKRLQEMFGSASTPMVSEDFYQFKKAVITESLTGNLTFRSNRDSAANYVFTGKPTGLSLSPINDSYIDNVMSHSSVRLAAKGRGWMPPSPEGNGGQVIRRREVVIRFDLRD